MSDCDELAELLAEERDKHPRVPNDMDSWGLAEVVWSAGWRKKPERDAMARAIFELQYHSTHWWDAGEPEKNDYRNRADAILALLDGPTETGGSK